MIDSQRILDEIPPALQGEMTRRLLELRATQQPVVVAVEGAGSLIIGDDESFEQFLNLVERIETIRTVREGLRYFDEGGPGITLEDALAELRRNHDCSV